MYYMNIIKTLYRVNNFILNYVNNIICSENVQIKK